MMIADRRRAVRTLRTTVLMAAVGLALAGPLEAQRTGRRSGTPEERAQMEERFRRQFAKLIQDRLGLSESESSELSVLVREFEGRRRRLARDEQATRRQVEELLAGNANDAAARALLTSMVENRRAESELFAEEQAALLEVLTPVQLLQLQELRNELGRRIRALRGGDDSQRRRGGGADRGA